MVFFIGCWINLKLLYGFLWLFVCCSVLFVFLPSSLFPFVFLVLLFCALRPAFFWVGLWLGVFVGCAFCLRAGLLSCSFFTAFLVLLFDCFFLFH